ncbi:MAG: hypothetical protein SVR08_10605 [Spirochaetota bacterium]|nr:hypothetical protein [Spirochaetota bacterium]
MYIHIGNRRVVSDKEIIGIFNAETIMMSKENAAYIKHIKQEDKSIIVYNNNNIISSSISPYTIINRATEEISVMNDIIMIKPK